MKTKIEKNLIVAQWLKKWSASKNRSSMAILNGCIMDQTVSGSIRFQWTDLSTAETIEIENPESEFSGSVYVDFAAMEFLSKVLKKSSVEIEKETVDGISTIKISVDGSDAIFNCLDVADYPTMPKKPTTDFNRFNVSVSDLEYCIKAVSTDETRPHINGILFESDKIVSTDGHRLHMVKTLSNPIGVVKNTTCVDLVKTMKTKKMNDLSCATDSGNLWTVAVFESATVTSCAKLIEAEFPPYDQVIPRGFERGIRILKNQISDICERIGKKDKGGIKINLSENGSMAEYENPAKMGFKFPLNAAQGVDISIGFNAGYMNDAICEPASNVLVAGPLDPCLVVTGNRQAVVMPMRI